MSRKEKIGYYQGRLHRVFGSTATLPTLPTGKSNFTKDINKYIASVPTKQGLSPSDAQHLMTLLKNKQEVPLHKKNGRKLLAWLQNGTLHESSTGLVEKLNAPYIFHVVSYLKAGPNPYDPWNPTNAAAEDGIRLAKVVHGNVIPLPSEKHPFHYDRIWMNLQRPFNVVPYQFKEPPTSSEAARMRQIYKTREIWLESLWNTPFGNSAGKILIMGCAWLYENYGTFSSASDPIGKTAPKYPKNRDPPRSHH
jgi:hypothetical protein